MFGESNSLINRSDCTFTVCPVFAITGVTAILFGILVT